jgi:formate-dependent phosphoribosylglycinamide formyltransferase (GAR transformylase)
MSVACDSYAGAPAMQVADDVRVFNMLDEASAARCHCQTTNPI